LSKKQSTSSDNAATSSSDTTTNGSTQTTQNDTTSVRTFKDGTYTASGNYSTPGGRESVTVTVTLKNNIVTDVNTTGSATRGDSAEYQSAFLSGYKSQVVGKSINSISLSRVAGSSLTSDGFNKALDSIENDAKA
jgi:uncharacterized protein with FMN-binding domain